MASWQNRSIKRDEIYKAIDTVTNHLYNSAYGLAIVGILNMATERRFQDENLAENQQYTEQMV
ncbi:MAG: hypothetical protein KAV68_01945 [Dehalococcoidales bacterium]|nr:hypothetical protein [Dehalococcoidales bacterium]